MDALSGGEDRINILILAVKLIMMLLMKWKEAKSIGVDWKIENALKKELDEVGVKVKEWCDDCIKKYALTN